MRLRVLSSVLLALTGAVVVFVSVRAQAADRQLQSLRAAAVDGTARSAGSGSAVATYLAALAAFANDQKKAGAKHGGERVVAITSAQQAVRVGLASRQPSAQRSQLENLNAVLEMELSELGGDQASAQRRAAARSLQQAVLDDDTNTDAKFNLELLIAQDPQAAKQRTRPQPTSGQSKGRTPRGKASRKSTSPRAQELGDGF